MEEKHTQDQADTDVTIPAWALKANDELVVIGMPVTIVALEVEDENVIVAKCKRPSGHAEIFKFPINETATIITTKDDLRWIAAQYDPHAKGCSLAGLYK